jgi:hypothetical protein
MKYFLNRKLFELFELFDKKVRNYSLFDKFLNPYLKPSLAGVMATCNINNVILLCSGRRVKTLFSRVGTEQITNGGGHEWFLESPQVKIMFLLS